MKASLVFVFTLAAAALSLACQPAESPGAPGSISAEAFLSAPPPNALVLDVRTPEEFASGHIASAINIPHDQLADRLSELEGENERPVVVYCERGGRAAKAEGVLESAGYSKVIHLEGDMQAWRSAGRPIVRP